MKLTAAIVATFMISIITGVLISDVGTVIQCSGKPIGAQVPFVVFVFCSALVGLGYMAAKDDHV